jgi:enoyl-CoA hydratase/carnithine racemase
MYTYTKDYDHVVTSNVDGHIATITLACAENQNRITEQQIDELTDALQQASWDTEVRVVLLTGTGPVSFGPGSLKIIQSKLAHDLVSARQVMSQIAAMVRLIYTMPKPVIGVAEGACVGGGANLLLSTDIVIVGAEASFQEIFVDYAMSPDTGGLWALQRLVGPMQAKVLAMTAETVPAAKAKELGMVYEVTATGKALEHAQALAQTIAAKSPLGVGHVKLLSNQMHDYTLETYLQAESDYLAAGALSSDFKEIVAAATEQRKPAFKGY